MSVAPCPRNDPEGGPFIACEKRVCTDYKKGRCTYFDGIYWGKERKLI